MPKSEVKKICIIRMSALGDVVHALALVNGLRKGFPKAHITWIIQKLPYEMVKHQSAVDQFIIFQRKSGLHAWIELYKQLKREQFDILLAPQVSVRASLVAWIANAREKIGFDWSRSRELHWLAVNRRLPKRPAHHVQDQYLEFLEYLGIEKSEPEWNIAFTKDEIEWKRDFFSQFDKPIASFVLASSRAEKDWDAKKYAKVMDYVAQNLNLLPLMVGGPSKREEEIAAEITERCTINPIDGLEGPIRNTMLQLAGSRVVVSPDTGPLHVAVAMGVPSVGLFGYSNPRRCGPYRKFSELLIDKYTDPGEDSGPIRRKTKPDRMQLITVEEVQEKIELALSLYPPKQTPNSVD